VATRALFPALPLPSMVKLNTGLKLAASIDGAQTEMISDEFRANRFGVGCAFASLFRNYKISCVWKVVRESWS